MNRPRHTHAVWNSRTWIVHRPDGNGSRYSLFQFHFKQASAAIRGTEQPATVPFGDNDLFQREVCIIQLFQTYLSDIGQQVRTATGIDKFLVELLV